MLRNGLRKQVGDEGLYLGYESANRRARAEGRREVDANEPREKAAPGPMVVLRREGEGYSVCIEPPLPTGNHRILLKHRTDAWSAAQALWTKHRLGFRDRTIANADRHNE